MKMISPALKNCDKSMSCETYISSIPGVFAGGDVVSGAATVILAMGAGKDASVEIDKYIKNLK